MPTNKDGYAYDYYTKNCRSLKSELKEKHEPKKCSLCPTLFKPINRFQRFCTKCRKR